MQDFGPLSQLISALLQIDPSARLIVPVHDAIEVICSVPHARACSDLLQAWAIAHTLEPGSTRLIPLHPLWPTIRVAAGPAALGTLRG